MIDVVGESEFVIVPLPDISDHVPVPTVAVLAVIKVFGLLMHIVWFELAEEMVGIS